MGIRYFLSCDHDIDVLTYFLKFCDFLKTGEQGVLELRYSCDKAFPWVPTIFYHVALTLSSAYLLKILTLLISLEQ